MSSLFISEVSQRRSCERYNPLRPLSRRLSFCPITPKVIHHANDCVSKTRIRIPRARLFESLKKLRGRRFKKRRLRERRLRRRALPEYCARDCHAIPPAAGFAATQPEHQNDRQATRFPFSPPVNCVAGLRCRREERPTKIRAILRSTSRAAECRDFPSAPCNIPRDLPAMRRRSHCDIVPLPFPKPDRSRL